MIETTIQEAVLIPKVESNWLTKSVSIQQLAEALASAQGEMENPHKDQANPYFKSKYADLAAVLNASRKALAKYGLSVVQLPTVSGMKVQLMTLLMHKSGEHIRGDLELTAVKGDPQAIGSTITYARRYALQSMLCLAAEDDDGNTASGKEAAAGRVSSPPPVTKARAESNVVENVTPLTGWRECRIHFGSKNGPKNGLPGKRLGEMPCDSIHWYWADWMTSQLEAQKKGKQLSDEDKALIEGLQGWRAWKDEEKAKEEAAKREKAEVDQTGGVQ